MLLQQQVISPISGPPVMENSGTSVFGSAVGLLVDWEPFDFGLRKSNVEHAAAGRQRAEASLVRTQFEAGAAAADAYLNILAAQETVKAAAASVERSKTLLTAVEALVRAELRPGADAAIARAETASAQAQAVRARQAVADAKSLLAALTGESPERIDLSGGKLLTFAGVEPKEPASVDANPLIQEQAAAVEEAKAKLRTFDRAWVPRFTVQGTTYARGTGARPDFTTLGGANGLAPNYYNWGVGISMKFPLMDFASLREQQSRQAAVIRGEEGKQKLIATELEMRRNRAQAALTAARELVELIPTQLEAARAAESQAQARYRAGLATIVEMAETQRTLAQAEIDDGLAKLGVWRALLALSAAEGDLAPFLQKAAP
jgi:outer membrane protein TolC